MHSDDPRLREEAARRIWEHYAARLLALARRHLDRRVRRREDEEDVLQSMYKSFCLGQRRAAAAPASRDDLWRLLVRITMCKVLNAAHRHTAGRRDVRRELGASAEAGGDGAFAGWMLEHMERAGPTPAEAAALNEEFQRRLGTLPEELRRIALWKLEARTNEEIAASIGRTVRSVELKLQLIRRRWGAAAAEAGPSCPASS